MRYSFYLALLLAAGLASGCVTKKGGDATARRIDAANGQPTAGGKLASFVLLRTDLGLGDGEFVRAADAELNALAQHAVLTYQSVGNLPQPLTTEAGGKDVGLPVPHSKAPGEMTLSEAAALLAQVPPCDVLVISSGYLLPRVLEAAAAGTVKAKALLLLDEQGMGTPPATPPLPVFRLRYDIRHMAFLGGIAAAQSSTTAHFAVMYARDDPQGERFASAAKAGAKYRSNGAWTETMAVDVGPDGYITAAQFTAAFHALHKQAGNGWTPDHYILDLGRSTPTIMNALSKKPTLAYLVGAYADYRQVRPAHVIGCALKLPGQALAALFAKLAPTQLAADPLAALRAATDKDGVFIGGLEAGAVDFTDFTLYARSNNDADEIAQAVEDKKKLIRSGEIGAEY